MFGSKAGGLTISTSAASNAPASGGLFGSAPTGSNLFGGSTFTQSSSNPFPSLTSTSQPTSNNLFGQPPSTTASTQPPSGGLFGGSLFGGAPTNKNSSQTPSSGLFGAATSNPTTSGASINLFGGTSHTAASQAPSGGLFGGLSSNTATSQPQSKSLFGGTANNTSNMFPANLGTSNTGGGGLQLGVSTATNAPGTLGSSAVKIDIEHLRPTTKFEQLNDEVSKVVQSVDAMIQQQIQMCEEVTAMLPSIVQAGSSIPSDVEYVTQKLDEVLAGLENDAEEINSIHKDLFERDQNDAKVCFRVIDRMKMPAQYQTTPSAAGGGFSGGVYGGSGLSGWWNNPQTLHQSTRAVNGSSSSKTMTLPEENEDGAKGPTSLVDLFARKANDMGSTLTSNRKLLHEIENFVSSVEMKILAKERELIDKRNGVNEAEDPVQVLRYVFGSVEKGLYDVADKVGGVREGVQELVLSNTDEGRSRLGW